MTQTWQDAGWGQGAGPGVATPDPFRSQLWSFLCEDCTAFIVPLGKERQGHLILLLLQTVMDVTSSPEDRREVRGQRHRAPLFQNNRRKGERGCETVEKQLHSALAGGERNSA